MNDAQYEAEEELWGKKYQRRVDAAKKKKKQGKKLSVSERVLLNSDKRKVRKEIRNEFQRAKS